MRREMVLYLRAMFASLTNAAGKLSRRLPAAKSHRESAFAFGMPRRLLTLLLLCACSVAVAQVEPATRTSSALFASAQYAVSPDFSGEPAKPLLTTHWERNFRTAIRAGASKGPSFAGHFTLVKWGCGSPCVAFVIVDAKTGRVYVPGFSAACADDTDTDADVEFRLTSRLVAVTASSSKDGCGTNIYAWDGNRLELIRFEPWHSKPDQPPRQ